jgi:hypothetical protein
MPSPCQRANQFGGGHLRLPQRHGAFQAHAGAPSVKKLLAYEKEVNEGFAKTG